MSQALRRPLTADELQHFGAEIDALRARVAAMARRLDQDS